MSQKLAQVAEDIIKLKFDNNDTLSDCMEKFFNVLRKHNIRQSTPIYDESGEVVGRQGNNFDYTICETLFFDRIKWAFESKLHFEEIPEDVQ